MPAHVFIHGLRIAKPLDAFTCWDIGDDLAVADCLDLVAYRLPLHRMSRRQRLRKARYVWFFASLPSHDRVALKFGSIGG